MCSVNTGDDFSLVSILCILASRCLALYCNVDLPLQRDIVGVFCSVRIFRFD